MRWFRRDEDRKVSTVLNPSVADRLEEVTDRLEHMVQTLQERIDQIDGEQESSDA